MINQLIVKMKWNHQSKKKREREKRKEEYRRQSKARWLLEEETAAHSSVLAWRIPGTAGPRGLQSMGSLRVDTTERLHLGSDTHSSALAWRIPGTAGLGGLPSMGSHRVGHDWATSFSCIGEGNGNPLQCSCLENPRDGGASWAAIYGVAQSQTRLKWLSSSSSSSKMIPVTSMIILNVNCLSTPVKRQIFRLDKKVRPKYMLSARNYLNVNT